MPDGKNPRAPLLRGGLPPEFGRRHSIPIPVGQIRGLTYATQPTLLPTLAAQVFDGGAFPRTFKEQELPDFLTVELSSRGGRGVRFYGGTSNPGNGWAGVAWIADTVGPFGTVRVTLDRSTQIRALGHPINIGEQAPVVDVNVYGTQVHIPNRGNWVEYYQTAAPGAATRIITPPQGVIAAQLDLDTLVGAPITVGLGSNPVGFAAAMTFTVLPGTSLDLAFMPPSERMFLTSTAAAAFNGRITASVPLP